MPILLIILAVVVIGVGSLLFFGQNDNSLEEQGESVAEVPANEGTSASETPSENETIADDDEQVSDDPPPEEDGNVYADGTYTSTGTYVSPAGDEEVIVSLTLEDDVVTAATFEGTATHPSSINNQGKFAEGYEAEVVGKPLDEISLTVVNGSSLTPGGFMDAVEEIKAEAEQA